MNFCSFFDYLPAFMAADKSQHCFSVVFRLVTAHFTPTRQLSLFVRHEILPAILTNDFSSHIAPHTETAINGWLELTQHLLYQALFFLD